MIALEPEAASLFCRDKKLSEFVTERGSSSSFENNLAEPGTHYMVVDIGGGLYKPNNILKFVFD